MSSCCLKQRHSFLPLVKEFGVICVEIKVLHVSPLVECAQKSHFMFVDTFQFSSSGIDHKTWLESEPSTLYNCLNFYDVRGV